MAERFVNPAPQLANGDFDLVPGGRLVFLETGTTAAKDVFADSGLDISLGNIVTLDGAGRVPNVWLDGSYKVRLHEYSGNPSFPLGTQLWERDPVGGDTTSAVGSDWVSTTIYSIESIVKGSDGEYYISIISSNQGNDPTSISGAWSVLNWFTQWNTNQTYGAKENVRGSDGIIYYSVTGSNLGNDPVTDDGTNWLPAGSVPASQSTVDAGLEENEYVSPKTLSDSPLIFSGGLIDVQVFTASGTWTKPDNTQAVEVWVIGGGGGSGGADVTTGSVNAAVTAGGAGGGGSYKYISSGLGSTETITIGPAGSAGAIAGNGGVGGNSSFGAHATANGGAASVGFNSATQVSPFSIRTTGGSASGGDINISGQDGSPGVGIEDIVAPSGILIPGKGGDSPFGYGVGGLVVNHGSTSNSGTSGKGFGAGGSGANCASTAGVTGAAGTVGMILVKSYA